MKSYLYRKVGPKWTKDLNLRAKTIKLLEDYTVENLHDLGFGNRFLLMMSKA